MRTTILQPTYLPWLGYFEMIASADQFVAFDHVQFEPKSWQQRNRILGPNGPILLTVPVASSGSLDCRIREKRIDHKQPWAKKHIKSIESSYRKTPFYEQLAPGLFQILSKQHEFIADLNLELIEYLARALGITVKIRRSSDIVTDDAALGKAERVLNLCKLAGATTLYDGVAAKAFLDPALFSDNAIALVFQDYQHPEYPQRQKPFQPFMSAVDLLFNAGPDSLRIIRSGATQ